jgi:hypothetical protein
VKDEETGFAIVPALHDVQRDTIKVDAGATWYEVMLAGKYIEPGPLKILSSLAPLNWEHSGDAGSLPREAFFEGLVGFRARFLNSLE